MKNLATLANPFKDSVVQDAWQNPADVPSIHRDVFGACLEGIAAAAKGHADSLLIAGPAGSGKTHLLTRLQTHLHENAKAAPDRVLHCVFVFVRLQTSPRLIWQHVRRRLATDLLRKDEGLTQLQRLVAHQLAAQRGEKPTQWVRALRVLSRADSETVAEHLSHVGAELGLSRDLYVTLEHLTLNRFVMDATAWLAGDGLPESVLEKLRLGREDPEDREDAARQTVTALCRLAGTTLPIVFCFDQIEALQQSPDDREALFSFGRMAADLHDADSNVFLISCVQSTIVEMLETSVREADKERAFRRRTLLASLSREEVAALVESRLDLVAELAAARKTDRLYPFGGPFIAELAGRQPCVPRRVIAACSLEFEDLQHGRVERDVRPGAFLEAELAERYSSALTHTPAEQTTRVLLHGIPLYAGIEDAPEQQAPLATTNGSGQSGAVARTRQQRAGVDFVLPGALPIGVSVRNETNMTSLAARLRRLLDTADADKNERAVILRDPRLPIGRTAKKTREYLHQLERRGIPLVQPSAEAIAALEALVSLLSDAKAGDLAKDGEIVSEATVRSWLASVWSLDSRLAEIAELATDLRRAPLESESDLLQDIAEVLAREHVILVEQLAKEVSRTAADVLAIARGNPDRFGLLQGPPAVLIDLAGTALEVEMPKTETLSLA